MPGWGKLRYADGTQRTRTCHLGDALGGGGNDGDAGIGFEGKGVRY